MSAIRSHGRKLGVALAVAAVALLAASHRFSDSAHAMGVLSTAGGRARHPVHLPGGRGRYTLVLTATALAGVRGDLQVSLEGRPPLMVEFAASRPALELGLRRRPRFDGNCFRGVEAGDRLSLWVVITPGAVEAAGAYALRFTDPQSTRTLLSIPVLFAAPGEVSHDS